MRVVVLGDIGQPVYHVGDEAMTHAVVDELRARGVSDIVLLSRDPEQSTRIFGTESVKTLEFPWPPHRRETYLREIRAVLAGDMTALPAEDQVHALIETLKTCDGVVIAGGGNMTSPYGWLLYERAAVGAIANALGKPLVISGQTVGPVLTGPDYDTVVELFRSATLSSVREQTSWDLMRNAGVPAGLTLDDASFFEVDHALPAALELDQVTYKPRADRPFLVATFAPGTGAMDRDAFNQRIAEVLDRIADAGNLDVVMIPHMSHPGQADIDIETHQDIRRRMTTENVMVCGQLSAEESASLTMQAEVVVASRYHPVVFALSAGVPCLGIAVDYYGEVRIGGALANWGLGHTMRSLRHLATPEFDAFVDQFWASHGHIRSYLKQMSPAQGDFQRAWWDFVVETLKGSRPEAPVLVSPEPAFLELASGEHPAVAQLTANNELHIGHQSVELFGLTNLLEDTRGSLSAMEAVRDGLQDELNQVTSALAAKESEGHHLRIERDHLQEKLQLLESSLLVRACRKLRLLPR
ncbi:MULTISPECIES: polysaccharide pyruvyl transferase family protein [Micrococcaceae]|uniref:polysaccharide pyruvyl transferase family protein n=1 Tax=Micrococcaceae TaxID=1268 RepID=UPI002570D709|nr:MULTISPECIES: polysaccharide pyruvyl transferase family protein [Micrococcaceae]MBP2264762.1 polysaccharide pyruvyl transferase WcaK-like protein [Pseudarthrobacter sp. PvP004]